MDDLLRQYALLRRAARRQGRLAQALRVSSWLALAGAGVFLILGLVHGQPGSTPFFVYCGLLLLFLSLAATCLLGRLLATARQVHWQKKAKEQHRLLCLHGLRPWPQQRQF